MNEINMIAEIEQFLNDKALEYKNQKRMITDSNLVDWWHEVFNHFPEYKQYKNELKIELSLNDICYPHPSSGECCGYGSIYVHGLRRIEVRKKEELPDYSETYSRLLAAENKFAKMQTNCPRAVLP